MRPDLEALWALAMPIKQARLHFAPAHLREELATVPAVSPTDSFFSVDRTGLKDNEVMPKVLEAYKSNLAQMKRRQIILGQIDSSFSAMVVSGELRCFAFEFPRNFASHPIEMLPFHWTTVPDWAKGEFRANGLHLIELRVLTAENAATPTRTAPAPSQGRPAFMNEIREAYEALGASNSLVTKPLSQGILQVRSWIKENRPNSKAAQSLLRDDTIRKALNFLMKV